MTASKFAALTALAGALFGSPALAAGSGGKAWSVESAVPVGQGRIALGLQAGWPRIEALGWYGLSETLDVGGRLAFNYGREGAFYGPGVVPGVRLQVAGRMELFRTGAVYASGEFAPGFGIDAQPGFTQTRILIPLSFALAFAPFDALLVHLDVDLPAFITPGTFGGFTLPILFGGGAEYALTDSLKVTALVRAGPSLEVTQSGAARFASEILAGVAYRL